MYNIYVVEGESKTKFGSAATEQGAYIIAAGIWETLMPFKGWHYAEEGPPHWWVEISNNFNILGYVGK